MKTVFIIHGTGGNPEGNWFPWMKQQLESKGFQVYVPEFPTPEDQSLENWKKEFERYKKYINQETIFIAHSVGPAFVLSVLETLDAPVKACYFVAGFLGDIGIPEFDVLNTTFVNRDFNWEKIKFTSKYFYMCHGSDDPYVSCDNALRLSHRLGISIDFIENGGHLNSENGYTSFVYLGEKIEKQYLSKREKN